MGEPSKKTLYLTPSNRAPVESWISRWRQHCALAMSRSFWPKACLRYGQYDVVQEPPFDTGEGFAGIGMGWSMPGNGSGIDAMMSDAEGVRMMLADEQQVFGIFVGDIAVVIEETVLRPSVENAFKLFLRVYSDAHDHGDHLIRFGENILESPQLDGLIRRLSVGKVVPDDYTRNSRFDFTGLLELSVDDLEAAKTIIESPQLRAAAEPLQANLRPDWRIIVTRENMFWDQVAGIDHSQALIRDYPPVAHPVS